MSEEGTRAEAKTRRCLPCDSEGEAVRWGYDGPGSPDNWASLSPEYAACADGRQQSPVDIAGYRRGDAPPLSFSYGGDADSIRHDGRSVHIDYAPGNALRVGSRAYGLESAHLHAPSEHLVDGAAFAAELHLVHSDAQDNLAVVGVLFSLGEPSALVQEILDAAPAPGDAADGSALNAATLAPEGHGYYAYDGSKTTPPCDEPVDWYVMRRPATISPGQADALLKLNGGPNNRPVQPIGNRVITSVGDVTAPGPLS